MGKIFQSDKMITVKPKLVRDLIPDIIKRDDQNSVVSVASSNHLIQLLKDKLVEESVEAKQAQTREELIEELADIFQVMKSICQYLNFDFKQIKKKMISKASQRGEFKKGYILKDIK